MSRSPVDTFRELAAHSEGRAWLRAKMESAQEMRDRAEARIAALREERERSIAWMDAALRDEAEVLEKIDGVLGPLVEALGEVSA